MEWKKETENKDLMETRDMKESFFINLMGENEEC